MKQLDNFKMRTREKFALLRKGIHSLLSDQPDIFLLKLSRKLSIFFQRLKSKFLITRTSDYLDIYRGYLDTSHGSNQSSYVSESIIDLSAGDLPVKLIAFYLPQFHPIPENDCWWGKGFTEWTNVSKAVPQFVGHYQPRLPGELGFYDLRVPDVQRRQVELAKKYGIYGFSFYYYWFNGKRLLERPLEQFMSNPEIDFPFCITWANENWTRRWDGREEDVLIAQEHTLESDMQFIQDVAHILKHKNYIRINSRPLVIIYRVPQMADPKSTVRAWRQYSKQIGIGDLYLVLAQTSDLSDPRMVGFDATVEFPPNTTMLKSINNRIKITNPAYQGVVHDYHEMIEKQFTERDNIPYKLYKTVFPSWDNEPRRPSRGTTFFNSSPESYREWLTRTCHFAMEDADKEKHVVFINAWNEWAEGAYLEPDRRYGYAYLQATTDTLLSLK